MSWNEMNDITRHVGLSILGAFLGALLAVSLAGSGACVQFWGSPPVYGLWETAFFEYVVRTLTILCPLGAGVGLLVSFAPRITG